MKVSNQRLVDLAELARNCDIWAQPYEGGYRWDQRAWAEILELEDICDELLKLRQQVATRPTQHELILAEEEWRVLHPISCDIRNCNVVVENDINHLLWIHGPGKTLVLDENTGSWIEPTG
jgi:hypothetical protein